MSRDALLGTHVWPWPTRPRVVVEDPVLGRGLDAASALRRAGYTVAVCGGPSAEGRLRCALVEEEACALVDGADAVVFRLDVARPEAEGVLSALRRRRPGTPLVAVVDDAATPGELVAAVDRACAARTEAPA